MKNRLDNYPEDILILGNHDLPVKYPKNSHLYCSGFDYHKATAVNDVLSPDDWSKLKYFYVEQDVMFSHAGLSKSLLDLLVNAGKTDEFEYTLNNVSKRLNDWVIDCENHLKINHPHWLVAADYTRGGPAEVGGIDWVDHSIFVPTDFVQCYGHSPHKFCDFKFMSKYGPLSISTESNALLRNTDEKFSSAWSVDLDTHLRHFSILDSGNLSIYNISIVDGKNCIGKKAFCRDINR
jgi:hypothetical protein